MRLLLAAALSVFTVPAAMAADTAGPLWQKTCAQKDGACWVEQFAISMPNKVVALHVRFDLQPGGAARMIATAPLGVALQPGLRLILDGSTPIVLPFERCTPQGCHASAMLDKAAIEKFVKGTTLIVRYVVSEKTSADIPIRLEGLKDALKSLSP
ncbi:MAG TPA: invasion associated locus B family protein [Magnetospirillum sp.]|jgi:invasion protein IalB|nr:invasion associated locus B family protein [Magnetospirillum sp.]